MRVVVDTCVFDFAFLDQDTEEICEECRKVIWFIGENEDLYFAVNIPLANEEFSCIEQEYRNKLGGVEDFEVFWKHMYETEKIQWVDLKCNDNIRTDLCKLGFIGKEDYVFVETACAADRCLISEDSDYGVHGELDYENVYKYLTEYLNLSIYSANEYINRVIKE